MAKEKTTNGSKRPNKRVEKAASSSAEAMKRIIGERSAAGGDDNKSTIDYLRESLAYEPVTLWDLRSGAEIAEAMQMSRSYQAFLDRAKTERAYVKETIARLEEAGFVPLDEQQRLLPGDRIYRPIRGKGLVAAVIGASPVTEGFNIVGAHIDSPRVDLKPRPLYDDAELILFKTHYYGGIKKYQWTSRPMALHGVVIRADGTTVDICVGEAEDDPVFCFTDLLPHLGRDQMKKTAAEVVTGEELNLLVGARPLPDRGERRFSLGLLKLLNEKYGITERDLLTAELEIVPAGRARDVGFDRALIGAYGQDDRICAWTAIEALAGLETTSRTAVVLLTDKEEIGSVGNTGAQARSYENVLLDIMQRICGKADERLWRYGLEASGMLSADVCNGFDPTFPSVSDKRNNAHLGQGVALMKVTGRGGKGGASDCSAEFMHEVTRVFDDAGVVWQVAELGRVDQGGGGTIAHFFARLGMNVLDCGVPLLSMHAPFEVSHVLDLREACAAYTAFLSRR
ncbi:MAG: aminopeptidase [Bacillota bacterium]|nr:aminopeptidase [Bacillota bacterium]